MPNSIDLTVIIPTLNESKSIGKVIDQVNRALNEKKISYEILISDNNSSDNTLEITKSKSNTKILEVIKKGYGSNLRTAILNSESKYTIFFDADGSYNPDFIYPMYQMITNDDLDIVYLNRLKLQEKNAMPFLNKYLGTPVLTSSINFFYNTNIKDCNSGMRIFKTEKIKKINFVSNGMEFASEFFIEAANNKLKLGNYIGEFRKDYRTKPPHLNRWRDGWRHLKFIISSMPVRILNILFAMILVSYIASFMLTFFKTGSGFPKFHTIIILISLNYFLQVMCISILSFKQKFPHKIYEIEKYNQIINLFKKNIFMIIFLIFFVIFLFFLISIIYLWLISPGYFINIEMVLRLIIISSITSFLINIEMILDNN